MEKLSTAQQAIVDLFSRHVGAEMSGDLETTMAGGVGGEGVRNVMDPSLPARVI